VITHHTDPLDTDSDNDGYSDLDEVLYGGNPNDPVGLPHPISGYTQTFDSGPLSAAWSTPPASTASWTLDATTGHAGSGSLKSGAVGPNLYSSIQFRAYFPAGQLKFYAKLENQNCCGQLSMLVDGSLVVYSSPNTDWTLFSASITPGMHNIEWRYQPLLPGSPAAWIDDVSFVPQ
jgi:hypothetical protein